MRSPDESCHELCLQPVLSVRTVSFVDRSGIAAMLTPHAICFRRGGTVAEMATEVDPQKYDILRTDSTFTFNDSLG